MFSTACVCRFLVPSQGSGMFSFGNVLVRTQVNEAPRPSLHAFQRSLRTRVQVKCSRSIPCRWRNQSQTRWNSTSSRSDKPLAQSIFNTPESPWEQLFAGPVVPPTTAPSQGHRPSEAPSRRVEMTTQEQKTFTDLFDEIFRVAEAVDATKPSEEGREGKLDGTVPAFSSDFYERIRRSPRQPRYDDNVNEELDRKKEEMELCRTDQELLEWTLIDVFAESQKYEAEARDMGMQTKTKRHVTLQPSWYPPIIALLMRTFRDKYRNPHTALAIFNYAKTASIASYAIGCSTEAYNELLQTHWSCFRDANAVLNTFKEMQVNGVVMDNKTGRLLDSIRRDISAEKLWSDEEVSNFIIRLDAIRRDAEGFEKASKKFKGRRKWDQWKSQALRDDPSDKWGFNNWNTSLTKAELA